MAMEGDAERLVVLLEARIRDFERNMAKASGTAQRSYRRMRGDSRGATRAMEADMVRSTNRINQALAATSTRIGTFAKSFATGFVGGVFAGGITGIVSRLGKITESVASIGDEARRAGVSARAFQEWKFVAEQNRIAVDSVIDGLKELNLRADEFVVTGKGPAAEAFARLGFAASDLSEKLKDPSALLLEIIGRLQRLDRAAQIRIADEIFGGTAGERFVELIDQGEAGIRKTIDRAHELGAVLEDDVIERAAEIDRKFKEITTTVGTALKGAVIDAADALGDFISELQRAANFAVTGERYPGAAETGRLIAEVLSGAEVRPDRAPRTVDELMAALGLSDGTPPPKPRPRPSPAPVSQVRPAIDTVRSGFDDLNDSISQSLDLAQGFASGLVADLRAGVAATDALTGAFFRLADQLLDMALNSAVNSLFGALLGGGTAGGIPIPRANPLRRQHGGQVMAGRSYIVGERRPELFIPNQSGTILPGVPGASPITIQTNITIEGSTNEESLFRLRSELNKRDERLRREVPALVSKAQRDRVRF